MLSPDEFMYYNASRFHLAKISRSLPYLTFAAGEIAVVTKPPNNYNEADRKKSKEVNMRKFNVTGVCIPSKHYMVDISQKLTKIKTLIDDGSYFTINRARQYGKSTTISLLSEYLYNEYICIDISFEGMGNAQFKSESAFCAMFLEKAHEALVYSSAPEGYADEWPNDEVNDIYSLGQHISKLCKGKKVVLFIDEVDKASSNRMLIHFLGLLRDKFLRSQRGRDNTFYSVILAGVSDIKNIKHKMINDGAYTPTELEGGMYNSPWNIAVNFDVDMSFNPDEISTMLVEYEADNHTGMDIQVIAEEIHAYTNGYPFLVSRICQCVDRELDKDWTVEGIQNAVKAILLETNVLFDDMSKNLENNPDLYAFLYELLIVGERKGYTSDVPVVRMAIMYGYIKRNGTGLFSPQSRFAKISNPILEMRLSEYFINKDANIDRAKNLINDSIFNAIVANGRFNMELCLCKFAEHYREIYSQKDLPFLERHGRVIFISYLRPLINGRGFYHIESQFTDVRRMDIVVDYGSEQFIIELKIWKGEAAQEDAYEQLVGYMNTKNAKKGYLLTFDFRKTRLENPKTEWVTVDGCEVFEVVV
jgi:hypothetical protein